MSSWVVGAEPTRTARTDERSVRARVSVSRTINASIVGTEVRNVTWKRPIASIQRRMRREHDFARAQRIHVKEGSADDEALRGKVRRGRHPRAHGPEVAVVR